MSGDGKFQQYPLMVFFFFFFFSPQKKKKKFYCLVCSENLFTKYNFNNFLKKERDLWRCVPRFLYPCLLAYLFFIGYREKESLKCAHRDTCRMSCPHGQSRYFLILSLYGFFPFFSYRNKIK